jgi:hypothetical protein
VTTFGLPGPAGDVPCLGVNHQIAQKLHACTERFDDRENDRVRDLPALLLLDGMVDDWTRVASACAAIFEGRGTHPWPPSIVAASSWEGEYARLAHDLALPVRTVREAQAILTAMGARIDAHMLGRPGNAHGQSRGVAGSQSPG